MAGHIATAKRTDWNTPKKVVDLLYELWSGPPDLDPCSNSTSIVHAKREIMLPEDGLLASWDSAKTVFVNPPYGRGINRWVEKCIDYRLDSDGDIIMLIPAAVDTKHFVRAMEYADRVCFVSGRLRFLGAQASAPFASAILYWGADWRFKFECVFSALGTIYQSVCEFSPGQRTCRSEP